MLSRTLLRRRAPPLFQRKRTFTAASRPKSQEEAPVPQYFEGPLEPNAPTHKCYILLHSARSPMEFPSVYKTPLSQELQARATQWGGLVNFSWAPDSQEAQERSVPGGSGVEWGSEERTATVFSHLGGRLEIPRMSLANVEEVVQAIERHVQAPSTGLTVGVPDSEVHLYVCTHGARDCRCGERGQAVYHALLDAVRSARERDPTGPASRVKIAEVGHIGGHKFAANVLYFPQGEWLGLVKPEDAPSLVAQACEDLRKGATPLGLSDIPAFPSHWRGRMGLTKDEQKALHAKFQAP